MVKDDMKVRNGIHSAKNYTSKRNTRTKINHFLGKPIIDLNKTDRKSKNQNIQKDQKEITEK